MLSCPPLIVLSQIKHLAKARENFALCFALEISSCSFGQTVDQVTNYNKQIYRFAADLGQAIDQYCHCLY